MSIMMNPERVDWVMRQSRWVMMAGLALLALGYRFQTFGFITGFFLIPLGAGATSLAAWRRKPGLWMLPCVFLALFLPIYAIFEYQSLAGGFSGSRLSFWQVVDFMVATALLLFQVRFFVTVARLNWLLSRHMKGRANTSLE
jgi:hypothetical protein